MGRAPTEESPGVPLKGVSLPASFSPVGGSFAQHYSRSSEEWF